MAAAWKFAHCARRLRNQDPFTQLEDIICDLTSLLREMDRSSDPILDACAACLESALATCRIIVTNDSVSQEDQERLLEDAYNAIRAASSSIRFAIVVSRR